MISQKAVRVSGAILGSLFKRLLPREAFRLLSHHYVRGESKIKGGGLRMFNKFNDLKQLFINSEVPFALRGLKMREWVIRLTAFYPCQSWKPINNENG